MDLGATTCTAPGGYCNPVFVQNVLNNALGQPCTLTYFVPLSTLNVGNVIVGNTGTEGTTLTVNGSGNTTISQVTVTPASFTVSGLTLPLTLSAGASTPLNVAFTPTATGSVSGNISIVTSSANNALNAPLSVPVSGYGVNSHTASLSWTASTTTGVTSYNIYRTNALSSSSCATGATAPATPYPSLATVQASTCSGTSCGYTDTSVLAGNCYWYYATAVSGSSASSPSNTAPASVPIP